MSQANYRKYLPKYIHIYDWLLNEIRQGNIVIGQKLPTELELMELFKVNRSTVRAAFAKLERGQMVKRQQGKGTFLISSAPPVFVRSLQNFSTVQDEMVDDEGVVWDVKELGEVLASPLHAVKLNVRENDPIFRVLRVGSVDDTSFVVEYTYVASPFLTAYKEHVDFTEVYYPHLEKRCGIKPTRMPIFLRAVQPDEDVQRHLQIDASMPCMEVTSYMYDQNDNPVELTRAIYRGDCYVFSGESSIGN